MSEAPYALVTTRRGSPPKASCCVYLIVAGPELTKIGMSNNPGQRLSGLGTSTAEKLTLGHTWRVQTRDQAAALEGRLHRLLKWARKRREWFGIEPRLIKSVGDALLAGEEERAELLSEELRKATAALQASEAAREKRQRLNRRWARAEREELAEVMDRELDVHTRHYVAALALGLEPAEWDHLLHAVPQ